jgi:DNA-binding transcriptional regulator YdaS (Cro superfamily)
MTENNPAFNAAQSMGGVTALARAVGVSRQCAGAWIARGRIPSKHVMAVSRATGIEPHDLNPDFPAKESAPTPALRDYRWPDSAED